MEGWTEEEIRSKELRAPCGLWCGACGVYIATRDKNEKLKAIMGNIYGSKPEETECLGCMQPDPAKKIMNFCKTCELRDCAKSKGFYSCHQCKEWPCSKVEKFGFAPGLRIMKKMIPVWRAKVAEYGDEKGSEEWARAECERYHCSACGKPLFRSMQRCRACGKAVGAELDGVI